MLPTKTFTTASNKTFTRHLYSVDIQFSDMDKLKIFTHGFSGRDKIWFLNKKKLLCVVDYAEKHDGEIYINVTIDVYKQKTRTQMSLDRFLYLIETGDFTITNRQFCETYLRQVYYAII